jgi:hypothetical protein
MTVFLSLQVSSECAIDIFLLCAKIFWVVLLKNLLFKGFIEAFEVIDKYFRGFL